MNVNWTEAYNRLFDIINAGGNRMAPEYFSGVRFLRVVSRVDHSVPRRYDPFIEERRNKGLSTTRIDYYEDVLNNLNPEIRINAYKAIIAEVEPLNPDGLDELKAMLGYDVPQVIKKIKVPDSSLSDELYFDIINTINAYMRNLENKPSLFQGKGEESLRDIIVSFLETRYERTTVTGETFNNFGKTDILIKKDTGENLFIGECKIWHGIKEFHRAIDQLFDNYITWRDTKAALIIFVKQRNIIGVVEKIKEGIQDHKYFVLEVSVRSRSSIHYEFRHKGDPNVRIDLEVMTFHYPDVDHAINAIVKRKASDSRIILRGFHDEEGFEVDISEHKIGDELEGRIGFETPNSGPVSLFNEDGLNIGGVINDYYVPYGVFREALKEVIGSDTFNVEIIDIEEKIERTGRTWFSVKII